MTQPEAAEIFAVREFNRFYTARLGLLRKRHLDSEFSLTESRILYEIWSAPKGKTAARLCATLQLDAGYMSRLLASLMKRKLVRAQVSPRDSRERLLALTAAGETKMAAINDKAGAQIAELLAPLGGEERRRLMEALGTVRALVSGISIVRLTEVTADALALLREYYDAIAVQVRDTPAEIEEIVRDPRCGIWLAYWEGQAVGCTYLHTLAQIPAATECKRLYVKPEGRGQGIAQALLDAQESFARKQGFRWIYLDSKDDLKTALELYRRRGFADCARYNTNPQATVFMRKEIGAPSTLPA